MQKFASNLVRLGLLGIAWLGISAQTASAQVPKNALVLSFSVQKSDGKTFSLDDTVKVRRGEVVKLVIAGKMKAGYHSFPLFQDDPADGNVASISISGSPPSKNFVLVPPAKETPSFKELEFVDIPTFGRKRVHHKDFIWEEELLVQKDAAVGESTLPINLNYQVCDNRNCALRAEEKELKFDVSAEAPLDVDPEILRKLNQPVPSPRVVGDELPRPAAANQAKGEKRETIFGLIDDSQKDYKAKMAAIADKTINHTITDLDPASDLWAFLLGGVFWGAISLITPCVFPMIPITVSIFLKQSEKEHHRPIFMATVYSGTIIVVLTLAAAFMLEVFRFLSVNPIMNYALGGLFVFFALSLFGMYEIELPSFMARFTSAHEAKGGVIGTMFMALTFTIISFACVAPFLGGFGGTAAGVSRPLWVNLLGGLAFSVTFAAPFFFLALFPTLLRKLPKSGSWLNSVKVVMGFLELAAAVKFCRSAELVLTTEPWLLTFDFCLGIYVALALFAGLYLLGLFRLPHDSPEEHLSVPRMVFAGAFIAIGLYLAPALMKNADGDNIRPRGTIFSWVESFLLPDAVDSPNDLPHTANLDFAVKKSISEHKLAMEQFDKDLAKLTEEEKKKKKAPRPQRIFLDFTGMVCTNCRINEKSVFSKHYIRQLMDQYIIVQLYCDVVPGYFYSEDEHRVMTNARQKADAMAVNLAFERKIFNNEQLPLYAILEPQPNGEVRVIGVYKEGRINNEPAFADFLRQKPN